MPAKPYQVPESTPLNVAEPVAAYGVSSEFFSQREEDLYTHEDVFREFARRLNQRIGTNISV